MAPDDHACIPPCTPRRHFFVLTAQLSVCACVPPHLPSLSRQGLSAVRRSFCCIFRDFAGEISGIMRAVAVFVLFFAAVYAQEEYCYDQVNKKCNGEASDLAKCDSKYGSIDQHKDDLVKYARMHLESSHRYLLMSLNFGTFEKNRPGFEKLFRGLSDEKWADTIGLIKHVTKRGGDIDWAIRDDGLDSKVTESYDINEAPALARAVDIEKKLAMKAMDIQERVIKHTEKDPHDNTIKHKRYDGEIGHYIEEEFFGKQAGNIRKLSGWVHDVLKFVKAGDRDLGLYLFDEYLTKQ